MSDLLSYPPGAQSGLAGLLDARYQIIQVLNSGLWGQTYLAKDSRRPSQPNCIIQRITPLDTHPDYQTTFRHLFVREAATLERLGEHQQIPQLLACFEDEQGFYLVQELVDGYPLSQQLNPKQPWSEEQVVQLLVECLEPLAFVHEHCCRHGDLRPDNLVRRLQDDRLVLIHFGNVREIHLSLMTLAGCGSQPSIANDQGYQPPEQLQGLPCLASDIYALGLIGIQALTGIYPTQLQTDAKTGDFIWQPFCQTRDLAQASKLAAILTQMVRYDCTQRFRSAKEVLEALQPLHQGSPIQTSPAGTAPVDDALIDAIDWDSFFAEPGSRLNLPVQPPATVQAPATPPAQEPVQVKPHGVMTSPAVQLGIGLGAVITTAVCGYALPHLLERNDRGNQTLEQATAQFQAGQFQKAIFLAESIPKHSTAYTPARNTIAAWQKEWKTAEVKYQAAETAFKQSNWREVLQQAQGLPKITYWRQRMAPLLLQATMKANGEAADLLQQAYRQAADKNFAAAISDLQQIPIGTSVYATAQKKNQEYQEKQEIRAVSHLQSAYDRAILYDFEGALTYLKQIPEGTSTYAKAQEKIKEYTQKQRIRAEAPPVDQQPQSPRLTAISVSPQMVGAIAQNLNPGSYLREANL